jgi:hypothetical protein
MANFDASDPILVGGISGGGISYSAEEHGTIIGKIDVSHAQAHERVRLRA